MVGAFNHSVRVGLGIPRFHDRALRNLYQSIAPIRADQQCYGTCQTINKEMWIHRITTVIKELLDYLQRNAD